MKENTLLESIRRTKRKIDFYRRTESVNKKGIFHDGKTFSNFEKVNFIDAASSL